MTLEQVKKLGQTVGIVARVNRDGIISLLRKHGIFFERPPTDEFLTNTTIDALRENPDFKNDFNIMVRAINDLYPKDVKKSKPRNRSTFFNAEGGTDWGALGGGVLSLVGNIIGSDAQMKLAKEQAKMAAQQAEADIELAKLNLAKEQQKLAAIQAAKQTQKSNALMYGGLAVGGLVVVTLIVVIVKVVIVKAASR